MSATLEKPLPSPDEEYTDEKDVQTEALRPLHERHPDWPTLNVRFYYSAHGNKADYEGIAPYLKDADIFLIEQLNDNQDAIDALQGFAMAPQHSKRQLIKRATVGEKPVRGSIFEPIIDGIHNTKKIVSTIDLGNSDRDNLIRKQIEELKAEPTPVASTFSEALEKFTEQVARRAELENAREDIYADNFEGEIERILDEYPELKNRPDLNILLPMGSYHTRLTQVFKERGITTDRKFPSLPYIYPYESELQRSLAFGLEPTKELKERAYIESVISDAIRATIDDKEAVAFDDLTRYTRAAIAKLSPDDMENIYRHHVDDTIAGGFITRLFENRGLPSLPRSNRELLSLIDVEQNKATKRSRSFGRRVLRFLKVRK